MCVFFSPNESKRRGPFQTKGGGARFQNLEGMRGQRIHFRNGQTPAGNRPQIIKLKNRLHKIHAKRGNMNILL